MTKMEMAELARKHVEAGRTVTRVAKGRRAMSEREMYLAAHASDEELQQARIERLLGTGRRREDGTYAVGHKH